MNDAREIPETIASIEPSERTAKVTNITEHTLRFVMLDESVRGAHFYPRHGGPSRAAVVLDPHRRNSDGDPLPLLVGPANMPARQRVRQVRERAFEIAPKKSLHVPVSAVFALLGITCELCAGSRGMGGAASYGGYCDFQNDPTHWERWSITSSRLLGAGTVTVTVANMLKPLSIDSALRDALERDATACAENGWGDPMFGRRR